MTKRVSLVVLCMLGTATPLAPVAAADPSECFLFRESLEECLVRTTLETVDENGVCQFGAWYTVDGSIHLAGATSGSGSGTAYLDCVRTNGDSDTAVSCGMYGETIDGNAAKGILSCREEEYVRMYGEVLCYATADEGWAAEAACSVSGA